MIITRGTDIQSNINLLGRQIGREYKYLGTWNTENNEQTTKIRTRIETARNAFVKLKTILCSRDLTMVLRVRALRCYVFSILYYDWKAGHLNKNT